jgi:hypothetical protein
MEKRLKKTVFTHLRYQASPDQAVPAATCTKQTWTCKQGDHILLNKTNMDMQTGRPHIAQQNKKELLPAEQEAAAWPPLPIYSAAG